MLKWLKTYWRALVLSALIVAVLDAAISSALTCHPIANQPGGTADGQYQNECTALAGPVLATLIAIVDFLDNHGEAFSGAFTIVLAIFTARLWYSTEKLWTATSKSVEISERALIDLERAYIFVQKIDGRIDPFVHVIGRDNKPILSSPVFKLTLVNYGRTAAGIELAVIRFEILPKIPAEIQIDESTAGDDPKAEAAQIIIGPGRTYSFGQLRLEHQYEWRHEHGVRDRNMFLYCHGMFVYRDIFGRDHPVKFCRRWIRHGGGGGDNDEWIPEGGSKRNSA